MLRVHCVMSRTTIETTPHVILTVYECEGCSWYSSITVSVVIARRKHPVPSRTRKLSFSAPMVLQRGRCGRLGRRRTNTYKREHPPPTRGRVLSLFSCPHTPHPRGNEPRESCSARFWWVRSREPHTTPPPACTGLVARGSCSARFWSVRSRKTHINPTSFLTGPGEQILLPTDDVSAHTPGIPP